MEQWLETGFDALRISCTIGLYSEERDVEQDIFVDIRVNGNFETFLDYVELATLCEKIATNTHFELLEEYAQMVFDALFSRFPLSWAWIRIKKPNALPHARCSVVELTRGEKWAGR